MLLDSISPVDFQIFFRSFNLLILSLYQGLTFSPYLLGK